MIEWIVEPLRYDFFVRALAEIAIVGVLCGLVGCFVVLRGLAFIGDALAHAVFPGVVLSYIAGQSVMIGAFVFGGLTALAVGAISRSRRVSEDTAIGVIFAAFFALGVAIISRHAGVKRDLGSLLFGSILGVSQADLIATAAIGIVVLTVMFVLLKELKVVAFDSMLAQSLGYPVFRLDLVLLLLISATIVASLQTVGNILILALVVTPPATARLLTDRLDHMLAYSGLIGITSGVGGLYLSYHLNTAAGATIVLWSTACFLLALVFAPTHGLLATRRHAARGEHHEHHFHADSEPRTPS